MNFDICSFILSAYVFLIYFTISEEIPHVSELKTVVAMLVRGSKCGADF